MVYNYIQVVGQEMNGDIYNIRIPYTRKNELKLIFNLEEKGRNKEYWINNLYIMSDLIRINYLYRIDKSVLFDTERRLIINNYDEIECIPFNFYNVDSEEEYILYENIVDDIIIQMKDYNEYLTIEYICEEVNQFNNFYSKNINNII